MNDITLAFFFVFLNGSISIWCLIGYLRKQKTADAIAFVINMIATGVWLSSLF